MILWKSYGNGNVDIRGQIIIMRDLHLLQIRMPYMIERHESLSESVSGVEEKKENMKFQDGRVYLLKSN